MKSRGEPGRFLGCLFLSLWVGIPSARAAESAAPAPSVETEQAREAEEVPLASGGVPHGASDVEEMRPDSLITSSGRIVAAAADSLRMEGVPAGDIRLYWKKGLNYKVAQEFSFFGQQSALDGRIGMRLQVDAADYASSGVTDVSGGVDVRRFYIYSTGELDLVIPVLFAVDLGLEEGDFYVDDAYLWLTDLPYLGTLKMGQFTAPMSLAQMTSSGTRPFMETATPVESFAPGSRTGLQVASAGFDQRLTWQFGLFADTQTTPTGDASNSVGRAVARLTGLPIVGAEGAPQKLLHLGLSSSVVLSNENIRYRSRPESYLAPEMVDTEDIPASGAVLLGLEAAWVNGPISFQAEALGSHVEMSGAKNPSFFGLYAMGSWFLTGETRPFNRASAVFGQVAPKQPLSWGDWQIGAWELAARVSYTDLTSRSVRGGEVFTLMTGLNWYLNRYSRILFEYGHSRADGGPQDGQLNIFQMRLQFNI